MARDVVQALPLLLVCFCCVSCQASFTFTFTHFDAGSSSRLIFRGSARLSSYGNFVDLTRANTSAGMQNVEDNSGRVLYYRPLTVWPASFTTTFTVLISNISRDTPGDGLAFLVTPDAGNPPAESYGSFLGLFNHSTTGRTTQQLAVELDTVQNQQYDPDNNHVGIDTVGIRSNTTASLTPHRILLNSGRPVAVRISYDGWSHILAVYAAYADHGKPAYTSVLNYSMFLSQTVPRTCYVGFSGATGSTPETHRLLSWQFSSEILPASSLLLQRQPSGLSTAQKILLAFACTIGVLVLVTVTATWMLRLKKRQEERMRGEWATALAVPYGPRRVGYKQLCAATDNFSDAQLLGRGGFGSVFRGVFRDGAQSVTVAVKRIRPASRQAQRGFQAELTSMGRLRHRNLVPLLGWCYSAEDLLLVYEYMPHGSLDRHIFPGSAGPRMVLPWPLRQKALTGLASALVYLHEEWEQCVIHRDVKPSNVLLDADFNARLGDFGLARLATHDGSLRTAAAGTIGYVAPECAYTGHATAESDVFSFGIVALEVATGLHVRADCDLVEHVWSLHANGCVMEAADERLHGEFEAEQLLRVLTLGLACCQPDPQLRPSMRQALRVLSNRGEPVPHVAASRPAAIYVVVSTPSVEQGSYAAATASASLSSLEIPR